MSADDDIDRAVRDSGQNLLGLLISAEPRERGNLDREGAVTISESREVLLHEQGRGHEYGNLLAVLHRLERCTHGDLGLSISDIAADKPIHGSGALHIGLHFINACQLIRSLDVGECIFEFVLPRGINCESMTLGCLARGIQANELTGDLLDRLACTALGFLPICSAETMHGGSLAADVFRHEVELIGRNIESISRLAALTRGVLEYEVFASRISDSALHHLDVLADTVLLVHDEVAGLQRQWIDRAPATRGHAAHVTGRRALPGHIALGDQHKPGEDKASVEPTGGDVHDAGLRINEVIHQSRRNVFTGKRLGNALGRAMTLCHEADHAALGEPTTQIGDDCGVVALVAIALTRVDGDAQLGVLRQLVITGQGAEIPPAHRALDCCDLQVVDRQVIEACEIDRGVIACCGVVPGGCEELLCRAHEIVGASIDALRLHRHDLCTWSKQLNQ